MSTLPKTRSGKIMRRVLRAATLGRDSGDISTIEDDSSVSRQSQEYVRLDHSISSSVGPNGTGCDRKPASGRECVVVRLAAVCGAYLHQVGKWAKQGRAGARLSGHAAGTWGGAVGQAASVRRGYQDTGCDGGCIYAEQAD